MSKKTIGVLLACALLLATLAGCGESLTSAFFTDEPVTGIEGSTGTGADPATGTEQSAAAVVETSAGNDSLAIPATEAIASNKQDHDDADDRVWNASEAVQITLDGDTIAADGNGVTIEGSTATITAAGTYQIHGSLADGQIIVDTQDEQIVHLVLDGVDIHSATSAPIYIKSAEETVIVLAEGTENHISDGASYVIENAEEDEPNAAIFSKDDLTISGSGSLVVEASYNDAIASKDGLVIAGGTLIVSAVDDGLRGKDYLVVKDGNLAVTAGGDGLKSDEDTDATKGYVLVETGIINITAGGDALDAQTDVLIAGGELTLSSGGGSSGRIDANASAKGIKGRVSVTIDGGTLTIDSADDAIHSNGSLVINGGVFTISTGDDAMHADSTIEINGGEIRITDSYEGIESAVITINDGQIHVVSSDDGINVSGGNDGSGMNMGPGFGGGMGGRPGRGSGQDTFTYTGNYYLYIHGGYLAVDAGGDGLDSNGAIEMTDGIVLVNGPTENMNGALDYMGSFNISGGFLVAAGSAGMAEAPSASSSQCSVLLNLGGTLRAGVILHIETEDGEEVLTFAPTKQYASILLSLPTLANGVTYDVYYGGESSGTLTDSLYQGGNYADGTALGSFTISNVVTRLGTR
ncbi:MAG: carbohydrate-binding domain-containing protein [Anaerolineae bacterium]|nr:carbohydrate-binding domain-containing protein [Anaerolineae bacterium]